MGNNNFKKINPFKLTMLGLLMSTTLTACSGGGGEPTPPPPPPPPPPNTAPVATNDQASARDNLSVTIDVLANDSDGENDTLTILRIVQEPTNGTVSIANGQLVYTPNAGHVGTDSMTYEISDSELTAEAQVTLQNEQTATLSGIVTDSPIAGATVTLQLGGEVFETVADQNGEYQLPIVIRELTSQVVLSAVGAQDNQQQFIELTSYLGNVNEVLQLALEDRQITPEQLRAVNVTHLSTAAYLLALENNENTLPANAEVFREIIARVGSTRLLETAAFIKLLVDNPDYEVQQGQTTFSQLRNDVVENVEEAVSSYLAQTGRVDEQGNPLASYTEDLNVAITETINDPNVAQQFTADMVAGKIITTVNDELRDGFVYYRGVNYEFNADGTGVYHAENFNQLEHYYPFTWVVENGQLHLSFEDGNGSENIEFYDPPVISARFGADAVTEIESLIQNGLFDGGQYLSTQRIVSQTFKLIASGTPLQVVIETTEQEKIDIIEGVSFSLDSSDSQNRDVFAGVESIVKDMTAADLVGKWALPLVYEYIGQVLGIDTDPDFGQGEKMEIVTIFDDGSAAGQFSGGQFVSSISEGVITLSSDSERFEFTPFISNGIEYSAQVRYFQNNRLVSIYTAKMAKFDESNDLQASSLTGDLPFVYTTLINADDGQNWDGDLLDLDYIFSFHLRDNFTMRRVFSTGFAESTELQYFTQDSMDWSWSQTGNNIVYEFNRFEGQSLRQREWHIVTVDENGRIYVVEHDAQLSSTDPSNPDAPYNTLFVIQPRLQMLERINLSDYPDAWQETLDRGSLD
ncbi:Ig-like domain-containing protein [Aliiglaciecola sp. M165]|uniref:Ig-like domain-containing protein n=1 Tax=Aliiglaciecola sp. M165 TaxID=2593649 RepID=UPI0011802411|nr:Ig-like domain-containing protein [Aliiglaciecola sp. M165]TRY34011.1 hypothetical protein FM019_01775 [Aliiglaciecola sp. M165]